MMMIVQRKQYAYKSQTLCWVDFWIAYNVPVMLVLVLLTGLFWNSCGYKFAGEDSLWGSIRRVCIPIPSNRSVEAGLEITVANALIQECTRNGKVITSRENADVILIGSIESISTETITKKGIHAALERRVNVTIRLDITAPDGVMLWSDDTLSASEAYSVSGNKIADDDAKKRALKTASERLAETIYLRLSEIESIN